MYRLKRLSCALLLSATAVGSEAGALCVDVPEANLRQGPGTRYGKSWQVFRYMPFKRISRSGNWYRVEDLDRDTHWIHRRLVTETLRCAAIRVDRANVRSGPGTEYPKVPFSPVEKYYSFRVLGTQDGWVKVQDDVFSEGWVAKALLWMP